MAKKQKAVEKQVQEVIVLVHDPILGSRYELREVEVEVESIDAVAAITEILSSELDKATKNEQ